MTGHNIRTAIPVLSCTLNPKWPNRNDVQCRDAAVKSKSKFYFDRTHKASTLPTLSPGDPICIKTDKQKTWKQSGTVTSADADRRSYVVSTPGSDYVRNCRHLQLLPGANPEPDVEVVSSESEIPSIPQTPQSPQTPIKTPVKTPVQTPMRSASGRIIKKPEWLKDYVTS